MASYAPLQEEQLALNVQLLRSVKDMYFVFFSPNSEKFIVVLFQWKKIGSVFVASPGFDSTKVSCFVPGIGFHSDVMFSVKISSPISWYWILFGEPDGCIFNIGLHKGITILHPLFVSGL